MKPFNSSFFTGLAHRLTHFAGLRGASGPVSEDNRAEIAHRLTEYVSSFSGAALDISADMANRIKYDCESGQLTWEQLDGLTYELIRRLEDEMQHITYLQLERDETRYFSDSALNWGNAKAQFREIEHEASEGSKCFAVERYDGAVFHMMRVLEVGLNRIAIEFNVSFEHKSWGNVINEIEAAVRKIPHSDPDRKAKDHFYSAATLHFRFLKDAWRNYAMHVKETHDKESAEMILKSTSAFMRQLAAPRPF